MKKTGDQKHTRTIVLFLLGVLLIGSILCGIVVREKDTPSNALENGDKTRFLTLLRQGTDPNGKSCRAYVVAPLYQNIPFSWLPDNWLPQSCAGMRPYIVTVASWDSPPSEEGISELLRRGANVNAIDPHSGQTPLLAAIDTGNVNTVRLLLDHGADPRQADFSGHSPLGEAIAHRDLQLVHPLLDRYPDLKDAEGRTALSIAVLQSDYTILAGMLEWGLDIQERDSEGRTLLYRALRQYNRKMAWLLIQRGLSLDIPDNQGLTPRTLITHYVQSQRDPTARKYWEELLHYTVPTKTKKIP